MTASASPALTLDAVERIDDACDRFEAAWKEGKRPRLEDYLIAEPGAEHDALLRELRRVAEHYETRHAAAPAPARGSH
jgi:hypothetical protein